MTGTIASIVFIDLYVFPTNWLRLGSSALTYLWVSSVKSIWITFEQLTILLFIKALPFLLERLWLTSWVIYLRLSKLAWPNLLSKFEESICSEYRFLSNNFLPLISSVVTCISCSSPVDRMLPIEEESFFDWRTISWTLNFLLNFWLAVGLLGPWESAWEFLLEFNALFARSYMNRCRELVEALLSSKWFYTS